jgi:N utilization substance protein B
MLNRRFLRIKAFQALYSYSREENADATAFRKKMLNGLDKTYELYLFLLCFAQELKSFWGQELETEHAKFIPSAQQILIFEKLIANKAIDCIERNVSFAAALKLYKVSWSNQNDLFRLLWNELKNHELFESYVKIPEPTFNDDKALIGGMLEWICVDSEIFEAFIEEKYSNWEDDQVLVLTTLQKSLQMLKINSSKILPEKHKDEEEDLKFVKNLFDLCVQHDADLMQMIAIKTKNWDQDRIALVDLIMMKMALCEVLYFPYIPVKVTNNEYLELAKLYSTPNSHGFINGVLDKVQIDLRKNDKINKMGRGLLD